MPNSEYNLDSYYFELPEDLIAQHPLPERDQSRMMFFSRQSGKIEHLFFYDILRLIPDDAVLVINNTRVVPVRLIGQRPGGGKTEALLIEEQKNGVWKTIIKRAKRVKSGQILEFCNHQITARALERTDDGSWLLEFDNHETLRQRLEQFALYPLPPYIDRKKATNEIHEEDKKRYQTCFAKKSGAIAAPTAGLHFTEDILSQIKKRNIPVIEVTLHVGIGTFTMIRNRDIRQHSMHSEYFEIDDNNFQKLRQAIIDNRKIISVGTTSVRVLETLAQNNFSQLSGWTDIFIYPTYKFKIVNGLITNFHLPQSSLILLVSAFCGKDNLLNAYKVAVEKKYRFFSYGDCMFII